MHKTLLMGLTLLLLSGCDGTADPLDAGSEDAGSTEAGPEDGGRSDAGPMADGGPVPDAGSDTDAGPSCGDRLGREGTLMHTRLGPFRGVEEGDVVAFRGVPFAAPPVGDLRFRPPAPAACVETERSAFEWPAVCPQTNDDDAYLGDEDCLYLNVWTPRDADGPLPILVYIHGGGNVRGSTSLERGGQVLYDGAALAEEQSVVVVTLQYRVGAAGFLAHPSLAAESERGVSGNYAILDQVEALRWVRDNAVAFGGDPARTLLFGESAGARNTCVLLASPLADGLFSRALVQSGFCGEPPAAEREAEGVDIATALGCDEGDIVACLRSLSAEALARSAPSPAASGVVTGAFGPNVDGYVIPDDPLAMLRRGEHNRVPVVFGANAEETTVLGTPPSLSEIAYRQIVRNALGDEVGSRALEIYPSGTYGSPRDAYVALTTDSQFVCPARRAAVAASTTATEPVFRYLFSDRLVPALGAFHGAELFYLFGRVDALATATPAALALARRMRGDWVRFAATGNPGAAWPVYEASTDPYIDLGTPVSAAAGLRTSECDFWDEVVASREAG